MSSAQSWSVKGIDPKVREAAREAAARQGMSLGEYLNQALANHPARGGPPPAQAPAPSAVQAPALRRPRPSAGASEDDVDDDWSVADGAPRIADPARLAQRIESIERRTQLAVSGLDRAVSTIDRSVLGLAARVDDAEAVSGEAADRISDALEQFRVAGDILGAKLERAEQEIVQSREAFDDARSDIDAAKHRLEAQVSVAVEVARRAEAAASYLTNELENRDVETRETLSATLWQARAAAEEAARQANEASSEAIVELRRLQESLSDRLSESETSTRRAIESAVREVRAGSQRAENEARGAREALLEEVVRLETEIASRVGAVDALKAEHAALIGRIERAESGAREATAGLRQAAGAAIADLRNAQLTLTARLKQLEESGPPGAGTADLSGLKQQQQDIAERLAALESKTEQSPVAEALAAFERRLAAAEAGAGKSDKLEQVDGAVKTLDLALSRLAERIAETETTANTAIRTLEATVSSLGARVEQNTARQETEAVRALLEQRLDSMAQSVQQMVGEARSELAGQLQSAIDGVHEDGLEGALRDVNQRLAAAERRQAQTIEAISLEIKRMSETVDKRLRSVESRNDDAAASAVREELTRMSATLEHRFNEIERREAAGFDRMGLEVGRLSERLEERVGAVEARSAQAIEHVGEQVARMAERFSQKNEQLQRDLSERMLDSEDRAASRVTEAISSIMHRLAEVEQHSAEAIAPVQKAVTGVAAKLEQYESAHEGREAAASPFEALSTPSRRISDFPAFDQTPYDQAAYDQTPGQPIEPFASPLEAAQPTRAGPLPSRAQAVTDDDLYFTDDLDGLTEPDVAPGPRIDTSSFDLNDVDDLLIEDPVDDHAAAPPEDEDPFWSPEAMTPSAPVSQVSSGPAPQAAPASAFDTDEPLFGDDDIPLSHSDPLQAAPAASLELTEPTPAPAVETSPPGKHDYLAQARKAAQAQSLPKQKEKAVRPPKQVRTAEVPEAPKLRGSSRVVLWGSAGLIAVALMGGAWYFGGRPEAPRAVAPSPTPTAPTASEAPPQDPFAQPPGGQTASQSPNGAAVGATAAPPNVAPLAATPANTPAAAPVAKPGSASKPPSTVAAAAPPQAGAAVTGPVVAGPLPARNVTLEAAAQSGDTVALYELGLQRLTVGRGNDGIALLRRAADGGLAMAQYRMAKLYERGEGVPSDLTIARQWTERAAASGNRRAMHDLGVYFARGEGAPLDEGAAFRWFRQAAELGVADSQYNLGVLYQQGRGVGASPSEALFWFSVAARQGDGDAAAHATALEAQLSAQQVQQARERAEAFQPRAASAIANGDFGVRAWDAAAPAAPARSARR
jgi:localization factor PodJL